MFFRRLAYCNFIGFLLVGLLVNTTSAQVTPTSRLKTLSVELKISDIAEIQQLKKNGADVYVRNPAGATLLMFAALKGYIDIAKVLLEAKADVNLSGKGGITPLVRASQNRHIEIVTALINAGRDVNAASDGNLTPLFMAAQQGHGLIVTALLDAGADVNAARKKNGAAPLFMAAYTGRTDVVASLLKADADIDIVARIKGKELSPLDVAKQNGHRAVVKLLQEHKN